MLPDHVSIVCQTSECKYDSMCQDYDHAVRRLGLAVAEVDRLREALRETIDLCESMREYAPTLNQAGEERLRESLALISGAPDEQQEECFACHGTGKFEPCADEPAERSALTCAECNGTGRAFREERQDER